MVDKTLTKEQDEQIVAGFESHNRCIAVAANDLRERLRALERKYLEKAA